MIYTHSITSKGQVTIPKEFRDKLNLEAGGRAHITLNKKGEIVIGRPKSLKEIRAGLGEPTFSDPLTEREKLIGPYLLDKYDKSAR